MFQKQTLSLKLQSLLGIPISFGKNLGKLDLNFSVFFQIYTLWREGSALSSIVREKSGILRQKLHSHDRQKRARWLGIRSALDCMVWDKQLKRVWATAALGEDRAWVQATQWSQRKSGGLTEGMVADKWCHWTITVQINTGPSWGSKEPRQRQKDVKKVGYLYIHS